MTLSRKAMLARLGGVVAVAAMLGIAGCRVRMTGTEIQLDDSFFVFSLGAAPLAFLVGLLIGVTVLARRVGVQHRILAFAWHAGVTYVVLKLGAYYILSDALAGPDSLVHVIQPGGALAVLWYARIGAGALAYLAIVATMVLLVRDAPKPVGVNSRASRRVN